MLKKIYLKNFQSISSDTPIKIKPLTILCGPYSAGKSAISDALRIFQNWYTGEISNQQQLESLPRRGKSNTEPFEIGIEYQFKLPDFHYIEDPTNKGKVMRDQFEKWYETVENEHQDITDDFWLVKNFFDDLESKNVRINIRGNCRDNAEFDNYLDIFIDGKPFLKIESDEFL